MIARVEAVLFDLDGTLVDSERESAEAMARVLHRGLGIEITGAQRDYVVGHSWNEIHDKLRREHGPALVWDRDELIARSAAERVHVIADHGMTVLPGAVPAVTRLRAHHPLALVTGSSRVEAAQALGVLGLEGAFQVVLAAEDYVHGKPAPDGFLGAARALGVSPERCVVIEESAHGIAAGVAAGMTVVAVRAGNFAGHDQGAAHRIVDTLDQVTPELLRALVAAR
jgi:HAD superfamily hydrolase (TIGR01509 family)